MCQNGPELGLDLGRPTLGSRAGASLCGVPVKWTHLNLLWTLCLLGHFSHVRFFVTLLSVSHQAPVSLGFSRQEY